MRAPFLGLLGLLAGLPLPSTAQAQTQANCGVVYARAFSQLPSLEYKATVQGIADNEVRNLFGPRAEQCEEGAYANFMDMFRDFTKSAMRAEPSRRDKLLRLAIAAVQQAPRRVANKEAKPAVSTYRQVKSDLSATADDVGFNKTPLLQQLLDIVAGIGSPMAGLAVPDTVTIPQPDPQPPQSQPPPQYGRYQAPTAPAPSNPTPSYGTPSPSTGTGVQQVRVPTEPLPSWAVIQIYEMRDRIPAQDIAGIQIRLQAIINWMERSTQGQQ